MTKRLYYKIERCLGCKSCEIACAVAHSIKNKLFSIIEEMVLPRKKVYCSEGKNYPLACIHCKEHPCVDACIANALIYDEQEKIVLHNESRCIGCWICVMVCPYGAIRPDFRKKIPLRCDKCKDKKEPQCVAACPTKAIIWQEEIE